MLAHAGVHRGRRGRAVRFARRIGAGERLADARGDPLDHAGADPVARRELDGVRGGEPAPGERVLPRRAALELVEHRQIEQEVAGIERRAGVRGQPQRERARVIAEDRRDRVADVRVVAAMAALNAVKQAIQGLISAAAAAIRGLISAAASMIRTDDGVEVRAETPHGPVGVIVTSRPRTDAAPATTTVDTAGRHVIDVSGTVGDADVPRDAFNDGHVQRTTDPVIRMRAGDLRRLTDAGYGRVRWAYDRCGEPLARTSGRVPDRARAAQGVELGSVQPAARHVHGGAGSSRQPAGGRAPSVHREPRVAVICLAGRLPS